MLHHSNLLNLIFVLFQPFNDDYNIELDKSVTRIDFVKNSQLQANFIQKKLQLALQGTIIPKHDCFGSYLNF